MGAGRWGREGACPGGGLHDRWPAHGARRRRSVVLPHPSAPCGRLRALCPLRAGCRAPLPAACCARLAGARPASPGLAGPVHAGAAHAPRLGRCPAPRAPFPLLIVKRRPPKVTFEGAFWAGDRSTPGLAGLVVSRSSGAYLIFSPSGGGLQAGPPFTGCAWSVFLPVWCRAGACVVLQRCLARADQRRCPVNAPCHCFP